MHASPSPAPTATPMPSTIAAVEAFWQRMAQIERQSAVIRTAHAVTAPVRRAGARRDARRRVAA